MGMVGHKEAVMAEAFIISLFLLLYSAEIKIQHRATGQLLNLCTALLHVPCS